MRSRSICSLLLPACAVLAALALPAAGEAGTRATYLPNLVGNWSASLSGNTGCGLTSITVSFKLNSKGSGAGTASVTTHSTGCADSTVGGQDFVVHSLNTHGVGTATLTCGSGCGWALQVQVNSLSDVMTLTDVSDLNNTPTGVAIRQP